MANITDQPMITTSEMRDAVCKAAFGESFDAVSNRLGQTSSPQEQNIYLEKLMNQLSLQTVNECMTTIDTYVSQFIRPTLQAGAFTQEIENQLASVTDFDKTKFIPDASLKAIEQVQTILTTKDKKLFEMIINRKVFVAVFKGGSVPEFDKFIRQMISRLMTTQAFYFYKIIQTDLMNNVKLGFTLSPSVLGQPDATFSDLQLNVMDLFNHCENMVGNPTRAYNNDGRVRIVNWTANDFSGLNILWSPATANNVRTRALSQLYNPELLDINRIGSAKQWKVNGLPDNMAIVLSDNAYKIYQRLEESATQIFAKNITTYYAFHIWFVRGIIPWVNGFKYFINLTDKDTTTALESKGLFLGQNGTPTFGVSAVTGFEINIASNKDWKSTPITLGAKDWIEIRIMEVVDDKTETNSTMGGDIKGTLIYNQAGTAQGAQPDNFGDGAFPTTFTAFVNPTITVDGKSNVLFAKGSSLSMGGVASGTYLIQAFGYIQGQHVVISSGAQYVISTSKKED